MRYIVVAASLSVACTFLGGCASVPDVATATQTSGSYILDKTVLAPHDNTGKVIFKRDSWPGHAYRLQVYSDGKQIASIGNGEVLVVYLPVGRRIVGTFGSPKPKSETVVEVTKENPTFIHLTLSAWGWGGWDIAQSSY